MSAINYGGLTDSRTPHHCRGGPSLCRCVRQRMHRSFNHTCLLVRLLHCKPLVNSTHGFPVRSFFGGRGRHFFASVAQWSEQQFHVLMAVGSNPTGCVIRLPGLRYDCRRLRTHTDSLYGAFLCGTITVLGAASSEGGAPDFSL